MDTRLLRAFTAVASSRSVSAAARGLGYSQPAVSHQICQLERALGGRLFARAGGGMALTPLGRATLPYARIIVQVTDELKAAAIEDAGGGSVAAARSHVA